MDYIIKYAYVNFRNKNFKVCRKRWLVLYRGSPVLPARLVKYEDEISFRKNLESHHQYLLRDVIKVERYSKNAKSIKVQFSTDECNSIVFSFDSGFAAWDWRVSMDKEIARISDIFPTTVISASHANFDGIVDLCIRDTYLTVMKHGEIAVNIPIISIRKYELASETVFWFETGRDSPIGAGFLNFRSHLASSIITKLDAQTKEMYFRLTNPTARPKSSPAPLSSSNGDYLTPCWTHHLTVDMRRSLPSPPSPSVDTLLVKPQVARDKAARQRSPYITPPSSPQHYPAIPCRRTRSQQPITDCKDRTYLSPYEVQLQGASGNMLPSKSEPRLSSLLAPETRPSTAWGEGQRQRPTSGYYHVQEPNISTERLSSPDITPPQSPRNYPAMSSRRVLQRNTTDYTHQPYSSPSEIRGTSGIVQPSKCEMRPRTSTVWGEGHGQNLIYGWHDEKTKFFK